MAVSRQYTAGNPSSRNTNIGELLPLSQHQPCFSGHPRGMPWPRIAQWEATVSVKAFERRYFNLSRSSRLIAFLSLMKSITRSFATRPVLQMFIPLVWSAE